MSCDAPMSVRRYLGRTVAEMIEHGWGVDFVSDEYVWLDDSGRLESRCTGYVEECEVMGITMHVAVDKPVEAWLESYVHEFGHFQQWRDRGQRAHNRISDRYESARVNLEAWTKKRRRFSRRQLWGFVHAIVAEEADAEARAIKDVRTYGLPIDVDEYVQSANAYLLSYVYMLNERKCPDPAAARNEKIWRQMAKDMRLIQNPRRLARTEYAQYEDVFLAHANEEESG